MSFSRKIFVAVTSACGVCVKEGREETESKLLSMSLTTTTGSSYQLTLQSDLYFLNASLTIFKTSAALFLHAHFLSAAPTGIRQRERG